jgi:hypothetical protein
MSLKLNGINHPSFDKILSEEMRMKISESNKAFLSKVKIKRKIKPKTLETLLKMSLRNHGVMVKIFDKDSLLETFPTITSAAKYFDVSNSTIASIPNNGISNNYVLKFEEKDTRVWIYNSFKNFVKIFNTTKETSEWYNLGRYTLNAYIKSGK